MIAAPRIHRLPQAVADAIAAGEVVERPASVVKELVENAIDAGARRIDVDVDGGGLVRIQVADDGAGIGADDLELAVTRHATSKITDAGDLASVRTLGFRGEALASMAAVSDLRIVSRHVDDNVGHNIRVRAGEILERSAQAAPVGTTVEVCELFAATPARLRFLRATATEAAAAVRVAADLALTHPHIALRCHTDGRLTLRSPGGSLADALLAVFGPRARRDLLGVDSPGPVAVTGAISAPHAHRAGRSGLVLVVNGRRVHNRLIGAAVEEAYRGLVPAGRHPFGVVAVEMDPEEVDVNVHPTKREVRFGDERAVFAAVQRACWEVLRSAPPAPLALAVPGEGEAMLTGMAVHDSVDAPWPASPPPALEDDEATAEGPPATAADLGRLQTLGQVGGEWLVAAAGDAVVLVDPHAAHEKVIYEDLLRVWDTPESRETQLLLIPAVVECDASRMEAWRQHGTDIARMGFELEEFGSGLLRCTGVPPASSHAAVGRMVEDLVDQLARADGPAGARRHRLAAAAACHSAVRFGDRLDARAQQQLLDRLVATPGGMSCPHGRPSMLVLSDAELRRAFRRPAR